MPLVEYHIDPSPVGSGVFYRKRHQNGLRPSHDSKIRQLVSGISVETMTKDVCNFLCFSRDLIDHQVVSDCKMSVNVLHTCTHTCTCC